MYFTDLEKTLNIANMSHGVATVAKPTFWGCPCKHKSISDIRT